jgi:hypothetical protein
MEKNFRVAEIKEAYKSPEQRENKCILAEC